MQHPNQHNPFQVFLGMLFTKFNCLIPIWKLKSLYSFTCLRMFFIYIFCLSIASCVTVPVFSSTGATIPPLLKLSTHFPLFPILKYAHIICGSNFTFFLCSFGIVRRDFPSSVVTTVTILTVFIAFGYIFATSGCCFITSSSSKLCPSLLK